MNTHDIEQERQKFEAFMREKNPSHDLEHEFGIYRFSPVQRHWDTWQAAIEADCKRRGEPVAWLGVTEDTRYGFKRVEVVQWNPGQLPVGDHPVFTAPQPAEPVKVPSDEEIDALWDLHEDSREFARALLAKYSEQTRECSEHHTKCSEVVGYAAEDMASQGAQGFRDGYAAALDEAIAQCGTLDNDENSEHYRAGASWCAERIRALKSYQQQT